RRPRLERLIRDLRAAHAIEPEAALRVARAIPRVYAPVRQLALERIRLDDAPRPRLLALLLVLDFDEAALADPLRERCDEVRFGVAGARLGRLCELELAERLLELLADAVERRVRVRGVHRADDLQGQADRARLERCQARRKSEGVAVELFVDMDVVALERGVHRVTAATEVDQVEELEVLFELILRDVEPLDDLARRNDRVVSLAARREQVGKYGRQHREALRDHRAGGPFAHAVLSRRRRGGRKLRRTCLVSGTHVAQRPRHLASQIVGLERDRAAVLAEDPRRELRERRVVRDEDAVLEVARPAERALDPPGRVTGQLDARLADEIADLPRRPAAVLIDVELGRDAEVTLAPRCETDVAADARDAECADVLTVEVLSDHVPAPVVGQQPVRIQRPLTLAVARDRVV